MQRPWPVRVGKAPEKPAALLIVRDDRRGGWYLSLWHDTAPNLGMKAEIAQGFIQIYPVSAEVAARGLDDAIKDVFHGKLDQDKNTGLPC